MTKAKMSKARDAVLKKLKHALMDAKARLKAIYEGGGAIEGEVEQLQKRIADLDQAIDIHLITKELSDDNNT